MVRMMPPAAAVASRGVTKCQRLLAALAELATILGERQRWSEAEPFARRAVEIAEALAAEDEAAGGGSTAAVQRLAESLAGLARCLAGQERCPEGEDCARRAVHLWEQTCGNGGTGDGVGGGGGTVGSGGGAGSDKDGCSKGGGKGGGENGGRDGGGKDGDSKGGGGGGKGTTANAAKALGRAGGPGAATTTLMMAFALMQLCDCLAGQRRWAEMEPYAKQAVAMTELLASSSGGGKSSGSGAAAAPSGSSGGGSGGGRKLSGRRGKDGGVKDGGGKDDGSAGKDGGGGGGESAAVGAFGPLVCALSRLADSLLGRERWNEAEVAAVRVSALLDRPDGGMEVTAAERAKAAARLCRVQCGQRRWADAEATARRSHSEAEASAAGAASDVANVGGGSGEAAERTAEALVLLSRTLFHQKKYQEAARTLKAADAAVARLGRRTAASAINRDVTELSAVNSFFSGQWSHALPLLDAALLPVEAHGGRESETARELRLWAAICRAQQQQQQRSSPSGSGDAGAGSGAGGLPPGVALKALRKALDRLADGRQLLGEGRAAEAAETLRAAAGWVRAEAGEDNLLLLPLLEALGTAVMAAGGDLAEAEATFRQALTLLEGAGAALGLPPLDAALFRLRHLGPLLTERGSCDAAAGELTRAVAFFRAELGPRHLLVRESMTAAAVNLFDNNPDAAAHRDAEAALREVLKMHAKAAGRGAADAAAARGALLALADVLEAQGRGAEARDMEARASMPIPR
ncbi:unnamed protein product [Phaeothamnion confervicola]